MCILKNMSILNPENSISKDDEDDDGDQEFKKQLRNWKITDLLNVVSSINQKYFILHLKLFFIWYSCFTGSVCPEWPIRTGHKGKQGVTIKLLMSLTGRYSYNCAQWSMECEDITDFKS